MVHFALPLSDSIQMLLTDGIPVVPYAAEKSKPRTMACRDCVFRRVSSPKNGKTVEKSRSVGISAKDSRRLFSTPLPNIMLWLECACLASLPAHRHLYLLSAGLPHPPSSQRCSCRYRSTTIRFTKLFFLSSHFYCAPS